MLEEQRCMKEIGESLVKIQRRDFYDFCALLSCWNKEFIDVSNEI